MRLWTCVLTVTLMLAPPAAAGPLDWPEITAQCRPWAYHWWLGSAVDRENLAREIDRHRQGGLGGVHVVPIYGAQGAEDRYVEYLSPKWMELFTFAVERSKQLGQGVDMTTGTGWCFGGPNIPPDLGCRNLVVKRIGIPADGKLPEDLHPNRVAIQAVVACGPDGQGEQITDRLQADGSLDWKPPADGWTLYVLGHQFARRMVKRAAPGGAGPMINPFSQAAIQKYLQRFTAAFQDPAIARPRAMYHDSFEYSGNWAPEFPDAFAKRRGYRIEDELPALAGHGDPDRVARVRCDVSETRSDMVIEDVFPQWVEWCHARGIKTRNQAHGAPANWLDFYALADVPETEMFGHGGPDPLVSKFDEHLAGADRDPLISKFASSAAHVAGKRLVSAETGTWLAEHFCETFEELKCEIDLFFLAGVNHIIYHGCVYSPDDAAWPGWLFYASTQMNPRNPLWREAPALNEYAARCQSILQAGEPDNELLLYWPIHDAWTRGVGNMSVHNKAALNGPLGDAARALWESGYGFDYVSDRLLEPMQAEDGSIRGPSGATWQAVVVPSCRQMPHTTLAKLLSLAEQGATVIFQNRLPEDVPGLGHLDQRRAALKAMLAPEPAPRDYGPLLIRSARYGADDTWIDVAETVRSAVNGERLSIRVDAPSPFPDPLVGTKKTLEVEYALGGREGRKTAIDRDVLVIGPEDVAPLRRLACGEGRLLIGRLDEALQSARASREPLVVHSGVKFIRRKHNQGRHYFIVNHSLEPLDGWIALATPAQSAAVMDPMTGSAGVARMRHTEKGSVAVYLRLEPGHSIILRTFEPEQIAGPRWTRLQPGEAVTEIDGPWQVEFIAGGPELPKPMQMPDLKSWTSTGDPAAESFAGTARYRCRFDLPAGSDPAAPIHLDLGEVKHVARVRLNGKDLGVRFMHPYRLPIPADLIRPQGNLLEVEVTNLPANRIRDLDRRKVRWRIFHDINLVNIQYRPFDASNWPIFDSGLLGLVSIAVPPRR